MGSGGGGGSDKNYGHDSSLENPSNGDSQSDNDIDRDSEKNADLRVCDSVHSRATCDVFGGDGDIGSGGKNDGNNGGGGGRGGERGGGDNEGEGDDGGRGEVDGNDEGGGGCGGMGCGGCVCGTSATSRSDSERHCSSGSGGGGNCDGSAGGGGEGEEVSVSLQPRVARESGTALASGDRLHIPRDDGAACVLASVVGLKHDGPTVIVYDDMMWAAFKTNDVEHSLKTGAIRKVSEEEDISSSERARLFLCPWNGAPPDSFLFDEHTIPAAAAAGWRWFGRLVPAPTDGTHGQRYSSPRIAKELMPGSRVKLCGRVTRLKPFKRGERKERLTNETPFTVLGIVQASLPSQKSYWLVVTSCVSVPAESTQMYSATMFGKAADEVHVTMLDVTVLDGANDNSDAYASSVETAIVSIVATQKHERALLHTKPVMCGCVCTGFTNRAICLSSELNYGNSKVAAIGFNRRQTSADGLHITRLSRQYEKLQF